VVSAGLTPRVSLSYAVGLVAVAWADGPVGIDIEMDGPPVDGLDRRAWSRREAVFKADAEVRTAGIEVPEGYVGTVAGTGVSWRLAGPAASPR
jgi:phosphopantetheinyl transferase